MRTLQFSFSIILLSSLAAYSQKTADSAKKLISQANEQFVAAFNMDNAAKVASLYEVKALLMLPNIQTYRGRVAVKEFYKGYAGIYDYFLSKTLSVEVTGNTAYETGTYSVMVTLPGTADPYPDKGKYVYVWKKNDSDGKWRILYHISNSDNPPAK